MGVSTARQPLQPRRPLADPPFWGICLGHTFTHWYPGTMYILLPYIATEFGFSLTQAGFLITTQFLVKSICNMPIGAITDMTDRKNILMALALLLAGLPYLFMGSANAYWMFMILVAVVGIGNQMWHPASFSSLATLYPEHRGFVFGFHGMAANVGDLLAPVIIGSLLLTMNWREVVGWNILPGVIVAAMILLLFHKGGLSSSRFAPSQQKRSEGTPEKGLADYGRAVVDLVKNPAVFLLAIASGFRSMAQNGLMTFLPLYFALQLGLSPFWVGIYLAVMQGGGVLAGPLAGSVSDRVGRREVLTSGMVMTSIMVIAVVLVKIEWLLIVTLALLGFFLYSLRPVMQAWAIENSAKNMEGAVTSLLFTFQALLSAISPVIGGVLADRFGIVAAFYFVAVVILVGNVLVLVVPKPVTEAEL